MISTNKKIITDALRFSITGILSIAVQFSILTIFVELGHFNPTLSSATGFVLGLTVNYLLLYYWAFPNDKEHHIVLFRYVSVMSCAMLINVSTFWVMTEPFGIWYVYSQMIATTCSSFFSFLVNRHYTFS